MVSRKFKAAILVAAVVLMPLALWASPLQVQPAKKLVPQVGKAYPRGRVAPPPAKLAAMKKRSEELYGHKLRALPHVSAPSFDCRTVAWAPPVLNQGQCGSCWDFSGCEVCTAAFLKAGWPGFSTKDITTTLSPQMVLDCGQNGGCNGDDNTTVLAQCQATGLPTTAQYGTYQGQAGQCKSTASMTMYKISSWGFVDGSGQGVTDTQKVKDAMVAYGPIGCAVAAGSDWDNYTNGTITGTSTGIDHDVLLIGYDDTHDNGDGSKGAWIMQNSWDVTWGINGTAWIKYGADSIATESVFAVAPPPPTPAGAPVITSALTASVPVGSQWTYSITATNSPTAFNAGNLPPGLSYVTGGTITGTPTTAGSYPITLTAANATGAGTATLNLTVTGGPTPPPVPPTPPSPSGTTAITINATQDQVASLLSQLGATQINRDMKLGELLDAFQKCVSLPQQAPAIEQRLAVMEAALRALMEAELTRHKNEPPLAKK